MKRYMSLSQIIRVFIALFAIMLLVMLAAVDLYYYANGQRAAKRYAEQSLEESARLFSLEIERITALLQNIAVDGGGSDFCTQGHAWRNQNQEYLRAQFNQIALNASIVGRVTLYTNDGAYVASDGDFMGNPYLLYKQLNEKMALDQPFRKSLFYLAVPEGTYASAKLYIAEPIWDQLSSRISLQSFSGVLIAEVEIVNLLNQVNVTTQPLWLMDAANATINSLGHTGILSDEDGILTCAIPQIGLTLCHSNEVYDAAGSMHEMIRFSLFVGVLMVLLHVVFVQVFRRMVVRPIELLAQSVSHSAADSIEMSVDISNRNELVLLTHSINEMLDRIRKNNEEKTRRLRERAIFMQARINPHFLYNNLECIRGMAAMKEYETIRELTGVMADIFRYCNHSAPCVTLSEEIACAEKYFYLMSLRYPKRLKLQIEATEEAKAMRLPRMSLQPLMENSIRHGILSPMREKGHLSISAYTTNDMLIVTLTDDGCGMRDDSYMRLNQPVCKMDGDSRHIGVENVRSRLKLLFGANTSLVFSPVDTGGVRVDMYIPKDAK